MCKEKEGGIEAWEVGRSWRALKAVLQTWAGESLYSSNDWNQNLPSGGGVGHGLARARWGGGRVSGEPGGMTKQEDQGAGHQMDLRLRE